MYAGYWQPCRKQLWISQVFRLYLGVTLSRCCPCGKWSDCTCSCMRPGTSQDCPWSQWNGSCAKSLRPTLKPLDPFGTGHTQWATWLRPSHAVPETTKSPTGMPLYMGNYDLSAFYSVHVLFISYHSSHCILRSLFLPSVSQSSCSFWTLRPCCPSWRVLSWSCRTVPSHFWEVTIQGWDK